MKCNICSGPSSLVFTKKILNKYDVGYYQCTRCSFIQTEKPYWLQEAYENVITSLDIGLVSRNLYLATVVTGLINAFFDSRGRFLDYGGGYGLLVRLMRDQGFDFYREDRFCENLFAKSFDRSDIPAASGFELITGFEIFEHLEDPVSEVEQLLKQGNSILFSTELQPSAALESWEYLAPETGQHISFYSSDALKELGKMFRLNLYSNGKNMHLLSTKSINQNLFSMLTRKKVALMYNLVKGQRKSLLEKDYRLIKESLKAK
jgi:hypothetical protein